MVSYAELPVGTEQIVPLDTQGFTPVIETIVSPSVGSYEMAADYAALMAYNERQAKAQQDLLRYQANQEQARWAEEQIAAQNETTFTEDLAQAYVDFYEGDTTTAALLTDPVDVIGGGAIGAVTDIVGTDVIVGSIGAVGEVIAPITEPIGENLGKLIVPAAIIGGAILLLK